MNNIITYNIKLHTECQEDFDSMYQTFLEHQKVWNHMSNYTFKTKNINKKLIHDTNYHECRKLFPDCPSQIIIRAKDSVFATYRTAQKNHHLSKMEEPAKQKNLAIRLDKRIYTFLGNKKIKLTTVNKRIVCNYHPYPKFQGLLDTHKLLDPLIFLKNNQLWLSVSFEVVSPIHMENGYLGVDLGERRLVVTSEGKAIIDKQFNKEKRKLRYQKRILNSKKKTTQSSSVKNKLKKLKRKERNKNKNLCHHLSNEILKTDSNTIVLEDLSSLKKTKLGKKNYKNSKSSKNRLSQMPFYMLLQILTYKALLKGKKVVTVNPAYTSQNDYRVLKGGERKGCRYYASDGKVFDADWNASINIAKRYSQKKEAKGVKHPISFREPLDGSLNLLGRATSTAQSCLV
jgi:IS605 OrfB family transposase